jgi:uroporphyrinogen III methyltransferase/synthase
VYLVGAGPGDPGLITVRGQELLRRADVVLHDRLVLSSLLMEASPHARVLDVGKDAVGHSSRQAGINAALVSEARAGHVVVRLKGGDPYVFGRGWEELEACRAAGVACEVVPGLSSAIAAPAAAGIPITCRGVASSVAVSAAPMLGDDELRALSHVDTRVFLMGVATMPSLAARLVANGHDARTPCAVVERATMPGQRTVYATLATLAAEVQAAKLRAPAVLVVGPTAHYGHAAHGPLAGRRVVVTRPTHAASALIDGLRLLGADVLHSPLIQLRYAVPSEPWTERFTRCDWVVFTSRHGVRGFRLAVDSAGGDVRWLANKRIAAIGPIAATELRAWGIEADLVAPAAREASLVEAIMDHAELPRHVFHPGGTLGTDTFADALATHGVRVSPLAVYSTLPIPLDEVTAAAVHEGVDAILLASPTAVRALAMSLRQHPALDIGGTVLVCLGQRTARSCHDHGWRHVHVAAQHNDGGMIETLAGVFALPLPVEPVRPNETRVA